MLCINNHPAPDTSTYCPECGTALYARCTNGHAMPATSKFCGNCGAEAEGMTSETTEGVTPGSTGSTHASPALAPSGGGMGKSTTIGLAVGAVVVLIVAVGLVFALRGGGEAADSASPTTDSTTAAPTHSWTTGSELETEAETYYTDCLETGPEAPDYAEGAVLCGGDSGEDVLNLPPGFLFAMVESSPSAASAYLEDLQDLRSVLSLQSPGKPGSGVEPCWVLFESTVFESGATEYETIMQLTGGEGVTFGTCD